MSSQLQIDICTREEFKEYAEKVKSLPPATKDADKLVLYGLYKQATAGDVNTEKSKDEAMSEYMNKVKQLQKQTSTK